MRLLIFALCAVLCTGIKIRESRNYLEDNRVPPVVKPKNPHGTSRFNYTYLSVCLNGTHDDPLITVYAKECEDKESQVALGKYTNQVNTTGWGILEIETFPGHPYDVQAYAAGVAEGERFLWGILEIETFPGHPYDVQAYAAGVAEGERFLSNLQIF
ncbi:unnamed protein product [Strongylus vulgaris]|uniref:Phospholipase B-like n=1 Tax=Strongylus vulgaris TaxID=40348 RepID=A0A3P7JB36_STRVU|nr:unnamed protein product [Strongylus vulgaris]